MFWVLHPLKIIVSLEYMLPNKKMTNATLKNDCLIHLLDAEREFLKFGVLLLFHNLGGVGSTDSNEIII